MEASNPNSATYTIAAQQHGTAQATNAPQSQQAQAQPQYTTVGSLYHPQPQPTQPPARRGRAGKSLSLLHTETQSLAQLYSPLQQNFDRAVSPAYPAALLPSSLPSVHLDSHRSPLHDASSLYYPNMSAAHLSPAHPGNTASEQTDTDPHQEDDDHDEYANQLNSMNFKSLTNLASYSNPMQKAAQKMLSSHRPQFGQSVQTSGSSYQGSDAFQGQPTLSEYPRNTHPDSIAMSSSVPRLDRNYDYQAHRKSNYSVVLSKGPGAPAPLTAGPPGMRLHRPFALEQTIAARQSTITRPPPGFMENQLMANPYTTHLQHSELTNSPLRRRSTYFHRIDSKSTNQIQGEQAPVNDNVLKGHLYDTLSASETGRFFPHGFPPSFAKVHPPPNNWTDDYPDLDKYWHQRRKVVWEARRAKIQRDFYAGNDMINKDIATVIAESNQMVLSGEVRPISTRKGGKVINPIITVEDAAAMPTFEHAAPLLSLLFQTLTTSPDFSPNVRLPKAGEQVEVDFSLKGVMTMPKRNTEGKGCGFVGDEMGKGM